MMNPTQSAQPQAAQSPAPMQMQQAQPQAQGQPQAGSQDPNQPQTSNGQYDSSILQQLEQHLNTLPKVQQAFINHYLTPETATLMGIVGGAEVYDYFKKFTDPSKMAVIVPRNSVPQGGQAMQDDQQAQAAQDSTSPSQQDDSSNADQATAPQQPQPTT